jgi:8-oxo-dGTP diphosphatase
MNIRYIATAFIRYDDDWLLMRRSDSCKIAPGYWYGVGGHIEADEFSQPAAACIREIEEESGLKAEQIEDLSLKLIAMRRSGSETVINYIFTAKARTREVYPPKKASVLGSTTHLTPRHMARYQT